ncbi:MAG TPA: VIT domain-containing protein [Thermoanaerobaculia bacterium]|nr:VIT domain-containing protein [Thermoanaerobaculia bacterium]
MRIGVLLVLAAVVAPLQAATVPSLTVSLGDKGSVPLRLERLEIHALIRGHLARTTFELTYRNDSDDALDGDFVFPLPADAEVSDIGLYFEGHLRHGVALERVMAGSVYDSIVHRRADPALAEWTSSSRAFHFRVFPIPAHGEKVVHIAYDEELTDHPYALDLRYGMMLSRVEIDIDSDVRVDAEGHMLQGSGSHWTTGKSPLVLDSVIHASRNDNETALTARSPVDGNWYASAAVHVRAAARKSIDWPQQMIVLCDTSGSAVLRDDNKVVDYLRQLMAREQPQAARVIPFHVAVDAAQAIDAATLQQALGSTPYAGATSLVTLFEKLPGILATAPPTSRIVLITDGVSSLGDSTRLARAVSEFAKLHRRLTVINASPSPDDHLLGRLARATGGWYVDLTQSGTGAAVEITTQRPLLTAFQPALPSTRDMLPSSALLTDDAVITVSARSRDAIVAMPVIAGDVRHDIPLQVLDTEEGADLVRRSWARARLRELLDNGAPPEDVVEHGRQFNQLTPRTSLLVLETWRDYEAYGVPMPADVRAEKAAEQKAWRSADAEWRLRRQEPSTIEVRRSPNRSPELSRAVWFMTGIVQLDDAPLPGATLHLRTPDGRSIDRVSDVNGRFAFELDAAPSIVTLEAELEGLNRAALRISRPQRGMDVVIRMKLSAVAEMITVTASAPEVTTTSQSASTAAAGRLGDRLLDAFAANAPLSKAQELANTTASQRVAMVGDVVAKLQSLGSADESFRYYATARSILGGEKLFQAEAALAMKERWPDLAVRVLTDLIETYPDDAAILRIISRVLTGWGYDDLARLAAERALEIAPRQTQTWRELMLLDATMGNEKELAALQQRYGVYTRDERMEQTDDALKLEMQRRRIGTDPRIDPSAELQIEVMWDADYTDVDLHVVEPGGEEVSYQHPRSAQGGSLHADVTSGFGPETYTIARMASGSYQIVIEDYAADTTRMTAETLVHLIIYVRGHRQDRFIALTAAKDRQVVAAVP